MNWQSWQNLFQRLSLCSAGGLNAVCNSAGAVDEASDRKLRFAIHIQATQVTGYAGSESAVFQVDTDPAVAVIVGPKNTALPLRSLMPSPLLPQMVPPVSVRVRRRSMPTPLLSNLGLSDSK
jgi:hypothetical protein